MGSIRLSKGVRESGGAFNCSRSGCRTGCDVDEDSRHLQGPCTEEIALLSSSIGSFRGSGRTCAWRGANERGRRGMEAAAAPAARHQEGVAWRREGRGRMAEGVRAEGVKV